VNFSGLFSLLFCMSVLIKTRLHAFLIQVEEKICSVKQVISELFSFRFFMACDLWGIIEASVPITIAVCVFYAFKQSHACDLQLFRYEDWLNILLSKIFDDISHLEKHGIEIETEEGPVQVHTSLSQFTGDNLGMNQMLVYREFIFRFLLLLMLRHPKWYAKLWKRIRFYIKNERRAHKWLKNVRWSTNGEKSLSWGEAWITVEFPRQLSHQHW
jgi:hypothetical protein